jgi:hypothetical protein
MSKTILVLCALTLSACELGPFPKPPPQPEPPSPWDSSPDAAPPDEDVDAAAHTPCYLACQHLKALGCPESQPTAAGATCTQVCTSNASGPAGTSLNPECVARAESCSLARKCQ